MADKLEINNISKSYNRKLALDNVSAVVQRGEIVGLFGPNGAGKTTLFNIIAGLTKADHGSLLYNNHEITHLPIYLRSKLGFSYLPQEPSIFRGLSVGDNLRLILEVVQQDKEAIEQQIIDILEEFSILHIKDRIASALSGGERRRLEIARCMLLNPTFIMLDEPLAGIDPLVTSDIKDQISYLRKRNVGILITDHNVRETLNIVDRAYVIYNGKVLLEGSPEEIVASNKVKEVYLGRSFYL